MKNWITSLLIFVIAILVVIIASQNWPANAKDIKEPAPSVRQVVLLRCERKPSAGGPTNWSGNIKISASDQSMLLGNGQILSEYEVGKSCSFAIEKSLTAGFAIQSVTSDSSSAFNYTLIK